jgi:hypothetical protein
VELKRDVQRAIADRQKALSHKLQIDQERVLLKQLVTAAKMRWRIERDYHELKQEFGLSHFEGRGWRGFHHHATLCIVARRLHLSKSVVSERLAEVERMPGASLLHRTTRKVSLTEDGAAFLEKAARIMREVGEAAADMAERRGSLSRPLRISAPGHVRPCIWAGALSLSCQASQAGADAGSG